MKGDEGPIQISTMQNPPRVYSSDGLYDTIRGDSEVFIDEEEFGSKLAELNKDGYIEKTIFEDVPVYYAKSGLEWSEVAHTKDSIKKEILLLLINDPKHFFILQNTQKGKTQISSAEMKKWGQDQMKVVTFVILDNNSELAKQSGDAIKYFFGNQKYKEYMWMINSKSKGTVDEVRTYIDAYAAADSDDTNYPMPIICLLANEPQCNRMLQIVNHIDTKVRLKGSNLRYGMIWDEADKTYRLLRNKTLIIDGVELSCGSFILDKNAGLYRAGFVSATYGELLEEYAECANAYLPPVVISPEDEERYRALHHKEGITHKVPLARHTNNSYAMHILEENKAHFTTPIILQSGEMYYRKTIINSNTRTADMKELALWCKARGMFALVYNGVRGTNVTVYGEGIPEKSRKTNKIVLKELLFYLYKKLGLHTKPLVIIGNRKVDRGIGFHYCPRTAKEDKIDDIDGLGTLLTDGKESLIWTDEILGKVLDKDTAVQKAGRLAGIIGHSLQYHGAIDFWMDAKIEKLIREHNTIVDAVNTYRGVSAKQAVQNAKDAMPRVKDEEVDPNIYRIYKDEHIVRSVCEILGYGFKKTNNNSDGFKMTSLRTEKAVVSLTDAVKHVPKAKGGGAGGTQSRRYYPCYVDTSDNTTLRFVVIIEAGIDPAKVVECDERFPSLLL